jgi:hypothetical protein
MDIIALPSNRFLGLRKAGPEGGALLALPESLDYANHLGTVHASAQLALAEAKFKRPASGRLTSRASADAAKLATLPDELARKGRALIEVHVEVLDASGGVTLTANVGWFLAKSPSAL